MLPLRQREQYGKGGLGTRYWDFRDRQIMERVGAADRILDVGCGEGVTLERMVRKFPERQILGIDPAPGNVQVCRQHGLPAHLGSVYHLGFAASTFDCCLFLEVIEHLHHPAAALEEIRRVLRNGGLLLLLFPHDRLFHWARLACLKFREAFALSGHVRRWAPEEIGALVAEAGFRIQEVKCLPSHFWGLSLHGLIMARKS